MIKLRLWGLPDEVAQAVQGLTPGQRCTLTLDVDAVSPPRADRGKSILVRVFVEARNVTSSAVATASAGQVPAAAPDLPGIPPALAAPGLPRSSAAVPLEIPGQTGA